MAFLTYLHQVANRSNLTVSEAYEAMQHVLAGEASQPLLSAFLVALRMKGETADELVGFARAMRERATPIHHGLSGESLLDTCGTGGDGSGTFNISTVVALVVAGAGVKVAKHGNRSMNSVCGSADVLEGLGVNILAPVDRMAAALRDVGFGFFFAPAIHPAMKHAQPVRAELKMRTAFNLLGPLTNPAGATVHLAGAPSLSAAELIAEALAGLGVKRAFVVHGLDGLDEVSTAADTRVFEIQGGAIAEQTISPADFGLRAAKAAELKGGDRADNCRIAREILGGGKGAKRDIVLANASVALVAAGKAADFVDGVRLASNSIDSGAAAAKLDQLVAITTPVAQTV